MEIPLNAQVECTDGVFGRSESVLINPVIDQVTHVIVAADTSPKTEYLVPVAEVTETLAETIRLRCSKADVEKMDPFIQTRYIEEKVPALYTNNGGGRYGLGPSYYMPYTTLETTVYEKEEIEQIPSGDFTMSRGTEVKSTDGFVGKVDELVINPATGHITHIVMREGHLWGQKDVVIPLSAMLPMGKSSENTVFLNISKEQIELLPALPLHRQWHDLRNGVGSLP